ncbi:MAG: hypothetical protein HKO89_03565 [Saprospiraceae bacterium]|nr:hypothetical protein [Bacteroidia bacterium]NNK89662.1 hypothetical protein [Saprospiraceae bacterium]
MEKDIQMIWNYLDGTMEEDDKKRFHLRLKEDELFSSSYMEQLKLHEDLQKMPLSRAPESLMSNVMLEYSSLLDKRKNDIGFNGIRNIFIIFSGIILLTVLMSWFFFEPADSSAPTLLTNLNDAGMSLLFELSSVKILPYSVIFFCGMALVWLDHFLKQKTLHLSRG